MFGKLIIKILAATALLISIPAGEALAQHYMGVRGGYGGGSSRLYPERDNGTVWGLYNAGFSWKYYGREKVLNGIEVDVLFIQQGFKYFYTNETDYYIGRRGVFVEYADGGEGSYYQREVNSIMVPIFWQPHFYMFRQRLRIFLNAGVTFSYVLSQKEEVYAAKIDKTYKGDYGHRTTRDNRFMYGLCGGGGIGWAFDRWEVIGEFRYYIGYGDLMKNRNKNYNNYFLRSPLDKMEISVGVYYRLGKGGILSQPGPKMRKSMEEWEARRIAEGRMKPFEERMLDEALKEDAKEQKRLAKQNKKNTATQDDTEDASEGTAAEPAADNEPATSETTPIDSLEPAVIPAGGKTETGAPATAAGQSEGN